MATVKNNLTIGTYTKLAVLLMAVMTLESVVLMPVVRAESHEVIDKEMDIHTQAITEILHVIRADIREIRRFQK